MTEPRGKQTAVGALRLHLPLVLGVAVCLFAGWVELSRARAGHTIAWVYAVEWPMFAVAGTVMWWRVVTGRDGSRDERRRRDRASDEDVPHDDPALQAWLRYRAEVDDRGADERHEVD